MGSSASLTIQSKVAKETSNISFTTYQITSANTVAWDALFVTLKSATDAIILGVQKKENVVIHDNVLSGALPASNFARRENKLLIRYSEVVAGTKFRMEVPTPDNVALTFETGDANFVLLADGGVMAAWVAAWEALARSPVNGLAIQVDSAEYVGRNI